MRSVIVTGANGFVGGYVVNYLVQQGYHVFAIIRNSKSDISNLPKRHVEIVCCDLFKIENLPCLVQHRGFETFYHLAWEGSSGDKRKDFKLQMNNAIASANAVKAASELGCSRFVGAGSITELMYRDYLMQDGSTPDMVACYPIGKLAANEMCRCVATQENVEFVWGYLSNFYGVGDKTQNFINFLIESYLNNHTPCLTSGEQSADFTYVSDIAAAIVSLGQCARSGCSYYVGFGDPHPLWQYVETVKQLINPNIPSGLGNKKFNGQNVDFASFDIKKLCEETGYKPHVSFEEGIQRTINWIKKGKTTP